MSIVAKFGGRYMEWSTMTDQPETVLMSREVFVRNMALRQGLKSLTELNERLARADEFGTSSLCGTTAQDLLDNNYAGPNGVPVSTEEEMVAMFGGPEAPPHWTPQVKLQPQLPMELFDYTGFTPNPLPVRTVGAVVDGVALVFVDIPQVVGTIPVLINLATCEVLSKGFDRFEARNVVAE